jgi:hypothetical protein
VWWWSKSDFFGEESLQIAAPTLAIPSDSTSPASAMIAAILLALAALPSLAENAVREMPKSIFSFGNRSSQQPKRRLLTTPRLPIDALTDPVSSKPKGNSHR